MSKGNLKDQSGKGTNFPFQLAVLQLLGDIQSNTAVGPSYESRTTTYQATAAGPGYGIGDIIIRYDIIDVTTSMILSTLWFNQTTQAAILAPAPGNITPIAGPTSVTVNNGVLGAAVNIQDGGNSITVDNVNIDAPLSTLNKEVTQLLIKALLTSIDADTSNLNVQLSTRNAEATQLLIKAKTDNLDVLLSTIASEATLLTRLSKADFEARINTLGQKLMAASTPVVIASDQSSIPVSLSGGGVQVLTSVTDGSSGSVAAGATSVSFKTSVAFTGTINGITRTFSNQYLFQAAAGKTLPAIPYTVTAGSIDIDKLV